MQPTADRPPRPASSTPGNAYYLNGDFDLRLAGRPPDRLARLVPEMTLWYIPIAAPNDVVVVDEASPRAYRDYLTGLGLRLPRIGHEADARGKQAHPWAWDTHAVRVLREAGAAGDHPDLRAVRRVNGRSFAFELAERRGCAVPGASMCRTAAQAARALAAPGPWPRVIKPEYGNAGIGFRLVRGPADIAAAVDHARHLLESGNEPVFIEPWLDRRCDISVRFHLRRDGALTDMAYARARVSPAGVSYAIIESAADSPIDIFRDRLRSVATDVGGALHAAGYWGPANIDAMVARSGGAEELYPLLEVNARDSMSRIARDLAQRLGCTRWRQLRTVGGARPGLPRTFEQLNRRLGCDAFDPRTRHGILSVTPLTIGSSARPPHRSIFFMAADTDAALAELDRALSALLRPAVH